MRQQDSANWRIKRVTRQEASMDGAQNSLLAHRSQLSYHGAMSPGEVALFQLTLDDFVERLQKDEDFQRTLHVQ
jgi:hypothetical protein